MSANARHIAIFTLLPAPLRAAFAEFGLPLAEAGLFVTFSLFFIFILPPSFILCLRQSKRRMSRRGARTRH
jgi:hypothetical protein